MRARATRTLVVALGLLAGCRTAAETDVANGDDPIAALGAHVPSTRYGRAYWARVAQSPAGTDSALWARAQVACRGAQAAERPNCADVQLTAMYQGQSQMPARRPRDFKFEAPK